MDNPARIKARNRLLDSIINDHRKLTPIEYATEVIGEEAMVLIEDNVSERAADYSLRATLSLRDKMRYFDETD